MKKPAKNATAKRLRHGTHGRKSSHGPTFTARMRNGKYHGARELPSPSTFPTGYGPGGRVAARGRGAWRRLPEWRPSPGAARHPLPASRGEGPPPFAYSFSVRNDSSVNVVKITFECVSSIRPEARSAGDVAKSAAVSVAVSRPSSRRANA